VPGVGVEYSTITGTTTFPPASAHYVDDSAVTIEQLSPRPTTSDLNQIGLVVDQHLSRVSYCATLTQEFAVW